MSNPIPQAAFDALEGDLMTQRERLREDLLSQLEGSENANFRNLAGTVRDEGDESLASLIAEQNLVLTDRLTGAINAVEAALGRMDRGEYGLCEACGTEIALERLKAEPTASLCIDCQRAREQLNPGEEHPTL